jgi:hypothetical protein
MKIISFCLYGKNPIYNKGAIINCKYAKEYYPEFKIWIYISHPDDIDETTYNKLCEMDNVKIINMNDIDKSMGIMLWRYIPAFNEEKLEIFITRDLDSLLNNKRDLWCINDWINSDCDFQIIRDHPAHSKMHIMGGIWGVKGNLLYKYKEIFNKYLNDCKIDGLYKNDIMSEKAFKTLFNSEKRGINFDQYFLKLYIYPKVISKSIIYFSEGAFKNYPNTRNLREIDIKKCKQYKIIPKDIVDKSIGDRQYKEIRTMISI